MSRETRQANSAVSAITERSSDLVAQYTAELDAFVNGLVPSLLDNAEYAARTSALMIALNRELARCAAAFGEVHGVHPEAMIQLVVVQFSKNFSIALDAMDGQGQSVQ
jgi:16S rRNA C1402 N4-methylase RsmH